MVQRNFRSSYSRVLRDPAGGGYDRDLAGTLEDQEFTLRGGANMSELGQEPKEGWKVEKGWSKCNFDLCNLEWGWEGQKIHAQRKTGLVWLMLTSDGHRWHVIRSKVGGLTESFKTEHSLEALLLYKKLTS